MKYIIFFLTFLLLSLPVNAEHVNGYYRSNGTYVNGYERNSGSSFSTGFSNPYANPSRVNVDAYYRSNGTYVQPYQRTAPNNIRYDNLNYRNGYGY